VVGLLKGGGAGKTVALRADMDALPVREENKVPYRSRQEGKMHACGHDGHCAMLLGAARLMSSKRGEIKGNIKFIFQPGEETPPGGALGMIADGAMVNPQVDAIFGLHLDSSLATGKVGLRKGAMMAASDNFKLTIKGHGGHAARPHNCLDPIVTAAQIINGFQTVVSRKVDPAQPAVVTIGRIWAGTKHNIIPETAHLEGTARTIDRHTWRMLPQWLKHIASETASAHGLKIEFEYERGYPLLFNDLKMVDFTAQTLAGILGKRSIEMIDLPLMGGEDFSYFLQKVPGVFIRLGSRRGKDTAYPWHHPRFNIDESVLPKGAVIMSSLARGFLSS
jgi:amidohydrolase